MSAHPDVLVLGGGVIGLTTAYFLAREGVRVTLLDKGDFGQEASWAGAGILPPGNPAHARSPVDQLRAHSSALFPTLSSELRERTGIDNGYLRCGGLEFICQEGEAAAEEWRSEGIAVERLEEKQLRQLEPGLRPGLGAAYHLPEMAQVRNPRHLQALLAACRSLGVDPQPSPICWPSVAGSHRDWPRRAWSVRGLVCGRGVRTAFPSSVASLGSTTSMSRPAIFGRAFSFRRARAWS